MVKIGNTNNRTTLNRLSYTPVKSGIPLAAAYALAERRRQMTALRAAESNQSNRARSSGGVKCTQNEFFTPEEVRTMSQGEVRANLSKIMRSMKKWR